MLRILLLLALALLLGGVLAWHTDQLPLRPGLVGAMLMLVSAWFARRHWQQQPPSRATGSPERALWHGLASYGVLSGHLSTGMWMMAPVFDMHGRFGHAFAHDSWSLVLGTLVSYAIARDPQPRQDERDALIAAQGWRSAHRALLVLLVGLILALGFGEGSAIAQANQPMLAHLLILALLAHVLVQYLVRLYLYAVEARAAAQTEAAAS